MMQNLLAMIKVFGPLILLGIVASYLLEMILIKSGVSQTLARNLSIGLNVIYGLSVLVLLTPKLRSETGL